jgi:tellurite resistance protein
VGFFFWIILFVIFFYRAVFHAQLPEKFIPTFFILIAPPAIGFVSYMRIAGSFDNFALFMLFMSYFFLFLLGFMYQSFTKLKFFISWWAFTFPLSAVTIASLVAFQITQDPSFQVLSWIFFTITILVIAKVTQQTIVNSRNGNICIEEN